MKTKQKNFYQNVLISSITLCVSVFALLSFSAEAAVVARGTTSTSVSSRPTVSSSLRENVGRMPTTTSTPTDSEEEIEEENESEPVEEEIIVENKTSQFDALLSSSSTSTTDSAADNLAKMIQQQRAELDAKDALSSANNTIKLRNSNECDAGLRSCMQEKCGDDFTDCKGDTDTTWGDKMDACRRNLNCTGEEYRLFGTEIKADRDMNARLASYNAVLNCGNQYNDCIMTECGETFSKCLGKAFGDAAIAKCKKIADNCVQHDSGLASRAMQVFANLRQDAEVQVKKDEERLYELRDQMSQQCASLGAMFDERSLACVYTVDFYAGEKTTLYASKKLYAGDVFDCTPNWFGIDITTFKENAYRLTREQTSASSALMGAGLGIAAGAISSGAINRAIDRQKAEKELKKAKEEDATINDNSAEKTDSSADNKDTKAEDKQDTKNEKEKNASSNDKTEDKTENKSEEQGNKTSDTSPELLDTKDKYNISSINSETVSELTKNMETPPTANIVGNDTNTAANDNEERKVIQR